MKSSILAILKEQREIVSGEFLSSMLGISRVSIWKHIRKLQEFGYPITATPKGYHLDESDDLLYPWEFPKREKTVHYFPEVSSTMDIARDLARKGCPHFTTVIAGSQTKGRGRLSRSWLSASGGLYFTLVLRPALPLVLGGRVNCAAALALTRTLRNLYGVPAGIKWPNDIIANDDKLCGMLSEMEGEADRISFVNIGIGINVNNDPKPREQKATSIKKILGRKVSRKDPLSAFLDEFEAMFNDPMLEHVVDEWKHYAVTLNRDVKIVLADRTFEGTAIDMDETGALILKMKNGDLRKIVYGDCFHQINKA